MYCLALQTPLNMLFSIGVRVLLEKAKLKNRAVIISEVTASKFEDLHAPQNNENFKCFWCKEIDTQVRGYPEKLRILSAVSGVTRWKPK